MENTTALVHSIESCGVFDGPGIRTVIFLQGCKLRCVYCHNPDTWALDSGRETSIEELLKPVRQYKSFMDSSGGGVTISGGEPLLQKRFILNFFKALKKEGFHTCIDTNGMVHLDEVTDELLEYTDLFLLDIKEMDRTEHIKLTGKPNDLPLAFADYLAEKNHPTWIRHVVVPGYTHNTKTSAQVAERLKGHKNIQRLELLPYHTMGSIKYENMNIKNPLQGVEALTQEDILDVREVFENAGFPVYPPLEKKVDHQPDSTDRCGDRPERYQ
jgi:pyruvate formate lyase activating enzyme